MLTWAQKHITNSLVNHDCLGSYDYISSYAIAKSAIGPAPQADTKNSEVEQRVVWGVMSVMLPCPGSL